MARTLYWNPTGNANWGDANVWSLSDGGTRDQSTPLATDTCIFTNTNSYKCSLSAAANCLDLNFTGGTGFTGEFAGTSNYLSVYGSITLNGAMTMSYSGSTTFKATSGVVTITSNGKTFPGQISINGSGGTFRLADNLTLSKASIFALVVSAGTFDATTNSTTVEFTGYTGGTNASVTFYNLKKTGTASINEVFTFYGNVTVQNTLTINGNSAINRILVASDTIGTARTLTAATVTVTNADFRDITGAGAATWDMSAVTGGSGNCGGNSMKALGDAAFTTADTWYWHSGTGNVSDYTKWYTETNGGGSQMASTLVPLPQDTLRFDDSSFTTGSQTITQNMPRIGSIDFTGATNTPTFTTSTAASVFGSITLISGMTFTNSTQTYTFQGRTNATLDGGGKNWNKNIIIEMIGATLTLKSDLNLGGNYGLYLYKGTFSAVDGVNNYNVTLPFFADDGGTNTRGFIMGSGTWTVTNAVDTTNTWNFQNGTGLTVDCGTSLIKLTGSRKQKFWGASKTYYNIWLNNPSYITTFAGNGTFNDFEVDAGCEINLTAGTNQTVNTFTALGTSGSHIVIHSTSATDATLTKTGGGTITGCDYIDFTDIIGSPDLTWYVGVNSTATGCTNIYTEVPTTTNIKTYNTNLAANIKTINTNAIANVKTLNTNTNV